jgi:hypothetical protein
MIKHDHENESLQTISAKNKSESHLSDHISHFETETRYQHILAATRLSIHSKQILIWESALVCTHRNRDSFTESHQVVQKRKITASEKAYNRHVLEEKQFTNKTFTFIYYHLLSQKLEHDSIFSWS